MLPSTHYHQTIGDDKAAFAVSNGVTFAGPDDVYLMLLGQVIDFLGPPRLWDPVGRLPKVSIVNRCFLRAPGP